MGRSMGRSIGLLDILRPSFWPKSGPKSDPFDPSLSMISSKKGSQNGPPEGTSPLRRYFLVFDQKVVQKWLTFWKKRKSLLERERHFFSSQKRKCDNKRIYQQNALRSPRARGNVFWPLFDQNRWFWTTFWTTFWPKIVANAVVLFQGRTPNRTPKTTNISSFWSLLGQKGYNNIVCN